MDKQKRLHEISMNLFNGDHESIEHAIDSYTEKKKSDLNLKWASTFTIVSTVLVAIIIGQSRYAEIFEKKQLEYKEATDRYIKSLHNRIDIQKKVIRMHQYYDEMGIKPEYERTND
jgi:hypothetical protein